MTDLHAQLLAFTEPLIAGERYTLERLGGPLAALRAVVMQHKPELFGGIRACLACSPGMPPPILIEAPCPTVRTIARELGITAEEDHRG